MLINNKMKDAQKFNIPILTINDFINTYFKEEK